MLRFVFQGLLEIAAHIADAFLEFSYSRAQSLAEFWKFFRAEQHQAQCEHDHDFWSAKSKHKCLLFSSR